MQKKFAKKLTREYLEKAGVEIKFSDNGIPSVYINGRLQKLQHYGSGKFWYLGFQMPVIDEEGNRVKKPKPDGKGYRYKTRLIGLHRALWAFVYGEVPDLYVVDHIRNDIDRLDIKSYKLNELQCIPNWENLNKDKNPIPLKCDMNKPRVYYEERLENYKRDYFMAYDMKDARQIHNALSNICQTRKRIKYWDLHKEEYGMKEKVKKENGKMEIRNKLEVIIKIAKLEGNSPIWHNRVAMRKCLDNPEVCNLINMIYESEVNKNDDKR